MKKILLLCSLFLLQSCVLSLPPLVNPPLYTDLYKHKQNKIPKKIHQVWIGGNIAPEYFEILLESFKKNAPDYEYKLWRNADMKKENFPFTWDTIMKVIQKGIELYGRNENNWMGMPSKVASPISDLMRFEIIYHHGGFYFDVKSELLKPLTTIIPKDEEISFIVSNSDSCGFECKALSGHYVATPFFGAAPGSPLLRSLIDKINLDKINFNSHEFDKTTGPFYLSRAFADDVRKYPAEHGIKMVEDYKIYPYVIWATNYQSPKKGRCLSGSKEDLRKVSKSDIKSFMHKGQKLFIASPCDQYPDSTVMLHWELGKSWR